MRKLKIADIIKYFFQSSLIFIEFFSVCYIFAVVSNMYVPCDTLWDWIERGLAGYSIYTLIVQIILESANDAIKDSYCSLSTAYKLAILACEENSKELFAHVDLLIKKQHEKHIFNVSSIIKEYDELQHLMHNRNLLALKSKSIYVEHNLSASELKWKFTFLLRLFK